MSLQSAFKWTLVAVGARYALKLVGNLTLVRLLPAEAFGLTAIVLAIINGLEAITDVGARPALISSHRTDSDWLDTAWTVGVIRGFAIGLCVALAAAPLASYYQEPLLTGMIAATGLMSVFIGLTSNEAILAVRNLRAKDLAVVELVSATGGYLLMLTWAWLFPSAWALLAGALFSTGLFAAMSYNFFEHRRHRLVLNREAAKELIKFGKWVFFASLLGFAILQGDRFVIGKAIGIRELGIYAIAVTWSSSLQALCGMFLARLYLPVIANFRRIRTDAHVIISVLRRNILALLVIPFAFGAGTADQIISVLYPASYVAAGPIMSLLVLGAWFSLLESLYSDQLLASGTPAWNFLSQFASLIWIASALFLMSDQLTILKVAAVFAFGAVVRSLILLYRTQNSFFSALPDLLITSLVILSAGFVRYAANYLTGKTSALAAVSAIAIMLAPLGFWILRVRLRHIMALSHDSKSLAPTGK